MVVTLIQINGGILANMNPSKTSKSSFQLLKGALKRQLSYSIKDTIDALEYGQNNIDNSKKNTTPC